jgi:hypothetical protein
LIVGADPMALPNVAGHNGVAAFFFRDVRWGASFRAVRRLAGQARRARSDSSCHSKVQCIFGVAEFGALTKHQPNF